MADIDQALTLGELYRSVLVGLDAAGIADSTISARHITAAAAGCRTWDLKLAPHTAMTVRMVAHADDMTARRAAGEPLQYVIGSWSFRKLDLATDRRALIPRPETEVVAGIAIDWLAAELRSGRLVAPNVADLGTGCGAIALSVAYEVPMSRVFATDTSSDALALARDNMAGVGRAAARMSLHLGDWFEALADVQVGLRERLDVLIANPPYIAHEEELPGEIADFEPHAALYSGADGFGDLRRILGEARQWLAPGGLLVLECAPRQAPQLASAAEARGYENVHIERDLADRDRALVAQRPHDEPAASVINAAVISLRYGRFLVAPTDTLCGVIARYADADAVAAVCAAKERPVTEPMPILVSGLAQAEELVQLSPQARALANRHWPGGLTLVARRRGGPDPLHGRDTLGVRAPALGWLRWLIDEVGPVTGTSANRHGFEPSADAQTAAASLMDRPEFERAIPGIAAGGTASTVVDVTGDSPVVLREGAVPAHQLQAGHIWGPADT